MARMAARGSKATKRSAKRAAPARYPRNGEPGAIPPGAVVPGRIRWADDTPVSADDARGRILAAAIECVRRFGADKTGMDDVAKAAAITRPTVYKYFGSRNELMMAVFLRVLDSQLDRGLTDFFNDATSVDDLHDAVADSCVFMLGVLRGDPAIQDILYGSRLTLEDLLRGAADMLVGVMEVALGDVITTAVVPDLAAAIRPFDLQEAGAWIIRLLYSFLVWPGASPDDERQQFRRYLSPVFFRDPT
jgi:AcrR family transcriptional regulator